MEELLLKPMTEEAFEHYFQDKIRRYTEVLSENIHEQGEEPSVKALKQLNNLLPKGIHTLNHSLFNIRLGNKGIG